jgi:catechol 2,3-dioxygenase-like lactoylglutathione lyase family enzyme
VTASVSSITAFRLTTALPERLAAFYEGLGFTVGDPEPIARDEIALLSLACGGIRVPLRLGEQRVDLDSFDVRGRNYPLEATAADLCFQHLALVTDDAAAAWEHVVAIGGRPISADGPVRLPPATGVTAAVKFRDPEGHPLELLQFPAGAAGRWTGTGLLGIDHSAISVADVAASRRFYEALGLSVHGQTLNEGPTQAALDGLPGVEVDVVPLLPQRATPHLELLGYRKPAGRPAGAVAVTDIAATRVIWAAERDQLLCDPDGHLHLLRREEPATGNRSGRG